MEGMKLSRGPLIAITVLRVFVGWHFLYEGLAKLTAPSWSAAGYLKQARGPLAEQFRWLATQPDTARQCGPRHDVGAHAGGAVPDPGPVHAAGEPRRDRLHPAVLSVPPRPSSGYFYSIPSEGSYLIVNKNLVELCALVVILVTRSGLFAGLDRIVHGLIARRPTLAAA